jgi:hypothetical protein
MSLETTATPWAYDELQLIGAELGDTVEFIDEKNNSRYGVIVMLNKMTIYVLTESDEIVKFGRMTLMSLDNQWELVGLAEKQIRISAAKWKEAKNSINATLSRKSE